MLQGVNQRQGRFALGQIIADVLPQFGGVAGIVQHIVDELEGPAHVYAVFAQCFFRGAPGPGQHRRAAGRGLEQHRGLALDNPHIGALVGLGLALVDELQHLPLGDAVGGVRHDVHHPHIPHLHQNLKRPGIDEIPHQYAGGVVPAGVDRGPAAPQRRHVHHIIVQQRGGVDELHHRRQRDLPPVPDAAGPGRQQGEQRPQPFAPGIHDIAPDILHQRHPGAQPFSDKAVHLLKLPRHRRPYLRINAIHIKAPAAYGCIIDGVS